MVTSPLVRFDKYADIFQETFGCSLKLFFHSIVGFDVVAFDEQIVKSVDGTSCIDAIRCRWGENAVVLVRKLIG